MTILEERVDKLRHDFDAAQKADEIATAVAAALRKEGPVFPLSWFAKIGTVLVVATAVAGVILQALH